MKEFNGIYYGYKRIKKIIIAVSVTSKHFVVATDLTFQVVVVVVTVYSHHFKPFPVSAIMVVGVLMTMIARRKRERCSEK